MLHTKLAIEPIATSVSMLGERCTSPLKPLMKNFWLITITMPASSSCTSPMAMWLPSNQRGSGQPHIMCPMEKYISTSKKPSEAISRRFSLGVSWSASASSSALVLAAAAAFLGLAP